jgi:hypothetical protein
MVVSTRLVSEKNVAQGASPRVWRLCGAATLRELKRSLLEEIKSLHELWLWLKGLPVLSTL